MAKTHDVPSHWTSTWLKPTTIFREVSEKLDAITNEDLFNDPRYQTLMEAFSAARFAAARNLQTPCLLRMEDDRFPDFTLKLGEATEQFELTEADFPGRQRGREYREMRSPPDLGDPDRDLIDQARDSILRVIAHKAKKKYRPKPHLLVLVNIPGFKKFPIPEPELIELCRLWGDDFASIWLLWGDYTYRVSPLPISALVVSTEVHGMEP